MTAGSLSGLPTFCNTPGEAEDFLLADSYAQFFQSFQLVSFAENAMILAFAVQFSYNLQLMHKLENAKLIERNR